MTAPTKTTAPKATEAAAKLPTQPSRPPTLPPSRRRRHRERTEDRREAHGERRRRCRQGRRRPDQGRRRDHRARQRIQRQVRRRCEAERQPRCRHLREGGQQPPRPAGEVRRGHPGRMGRRHRQGAGLVRPRAHQHGHHHGTRPSQVGHDPTCEPHSRPRARTALYGAVHGSGDAYSDRRDSDSTRGRGDRRLELISPRPGATRPHTVDRRIGYRPLLRGPDRHHTADLGARVAGPPPMATREPSRLQRTRRRRPGNRAHLLLPPQSGTHSCIVDHSPGRSQVEALRNGGLTRVHCLEWTPANDGTDSASIDEHLAVVAETVEHLGGRVNIVGDSKRVARHDLRGAAPRRGAHTHRGRLPHRFPRRATRPRHSRPRTGECSDLGGRSLLRHCTRRRCAVHRPGGRDRASNGASRRPRQPRRGHPYGDRAALVRVASGSSCHLSRMDHAPPVRREPTDRRHARSRGSHRDLSAIDCPLRLIAGNSDPMATPTQVAALAEYVSTPPSRIVSTIVDTGHIGLFIGRQTLTDVWTPLARALAAVS